MTHALFSFGKTCHRFVDALLFTLWTEISMVMLGPFTFTVQITLTLEFTFFLLQACRMQFRITSFLDLMGLQLFSMYYFSLLEHS